MAPEGRQRLRPGRLGVGVAGRPHGSDEDLGPAHLAGSAVDHLDRLPGIVDEQTLAGRVRLAHGRRQPPFPGAVEIAPAAVAIAVGLPRPVLLPQQHERDAGPAQLAVDKGPVRLGLAPHPLLAAGAGIEHRLEHAVAQRRRKWPRQAGRGDAIEGQRHRAAGDPQGSDDRPVGGAALVLEPQDLPYASHRHPLGWHPAPPPVVGL
jgi:hypothetical protein